MIAALNIEIATVRERGGGVSIELRGGVCVGRVHGGWLYKFPIAEEVYLRDETPVRIICDKEANGTVVSLHEGVLTVLVDTDFGPEIGRARLVTDDAFLLERLKERLEKVKRGEVHLNSRASNQVLGLIPVRSSEMEPPPESLAPSASGTPNEDQISAVKKSLGSDVTFIWGPPGTGKTLTLARIIEAQVRVGRSVLLVSNTNTAVDTALERVADRFRGDPDFQRGLVLRFGPVANDSLQDRYGDQVILERVVERLSADLGAEKRRLQDRVRGLEVHERSLTAALKELEGLESLRERKRLLDDTANKLSREIATLENQLDAGRQKVDRLRSRLERAASMGGLRRFILGISRERLMRQIVQEEQGLRALERTIQLRRDDLAKCQNEIAQVGAEIERLSVSTSTFPDIPTLRKSLDETRGQLEDLRARMAAIDRELAKLQKEVLERCRVLATTVYRTYLNDEIARDFDVVVIDEASMIILPLVYYSAGLARQAVVVAGDFRQLPPIVSSDSRLAQEWLKRDVFYAAGIPSRIGTGQPTPELVVLGTQYRMCEPICEVVNTQFYPDHPLKCAESVRSIPTTFPLGESALFYVDTSAFHPWASLQTGTYSRYNVFHALLIRNLIAFLAEEGYIPRNQVEMQQIGVVVPYAAQRKLIRATLTETIGDHASGVAGTVHQYQGNEKSVMVVDLCDSIGAPLSHYHKATRLEEEGTRLLNVAISRARRHVILVGNFEFIQSKAPGSVVTRLIEHFRDRGQALEVDHLLPLGAREWIDGLKHVFTELFEIPDDATGCFNHATFYPAFRADLQRAEESIILLSPFITERGTARWIDHFRSAVMRGADVHILTRPPEAFGGGSPDEVAGVIKELRTIGIRVNLRADMHEKIAIIDRRVLWIGSLNILSHRNTLESMLRIVSEPACAAFLRLFAPGSFRENDTGGGPVELPLCPNCGGPMIWSRSKYGEYFRCENPRCNGIVDLRDLRRGGKPSRGRNRQRRSADR